mgnify:CR=1 FL=1
MNYKHESPTLYNFKISVVILRYQEQERIYKICLTEEKAIKICNIISDQTEEGKKSFGFENCTSPREIQSFYKNYNLLDILCNCEDTKRQVEFFVKNIDSENQLFHENTLLEELLKVKNEKQTFEFLELEEEQEDTAPGTASISQFNFIISSLMSIKKLLIKMQKEFDKSSRSRIKCRKLLAKALLENLISNINIYFTK